MRYTDVSVFHSDHLGSTAYLNDRTGEVTQFVCYMPYGETLVDEHTTTYENPFKFSGKELDDITGLYDHGARSRDPRITMWLNIDPLFEKYPDYSPYNYCAGNPVKLVDLDGREIQITDGENQVVYEHKMNYSGDNSFFRIVVRSLNAIYINGGKKVIDELINSKYCINIGNTNPIKDKKERTDILMFNVEKDASGYIDAGPLGSFDDYQKIYTLSHEIFHGFQFEKKNGGASVHNEVEAYVYSSVIAQNWGLSVDYLGNCESGGTSNDTANGEIYYKSFEYLISHGFSTEHFTNAVNHFKTGSNVNSGGLYNNIPLYRHQKKESLLEFYLPQLK